MPANANATGTAAVPVFVPSPAGEPTGYLFNASSETAYLGQAGVSSATGLPLAPGDRLRLNFAGAGTIWAVAGFTQTVPYGTANAATAYPGGSILTVASGGTAFGSGATIVVEPGTQRQEIATVFASNAGTVTASAAFAFGHGSGVTFSVISPLVTTVQVTGGAQ